MMIATRLKRLANAYDRDERIDARVRPPTLAVTAQQRRDGGMPAHPRARVDLYSRLMDEPLFARVVQPSVARFVRRLVDRGDSDTLAYATSRLKASCPTVWREATLYDDAQNVHSFVADCVRVARALVARWPSAVYSGRPFAHVFFDTIERDARCSITFYGIAPTRLFAATWAHVNDAGVDKAFRERFEVEMRDDDATNVCLGGRVCRLLNALIGLQPSAPKRSTGAVEHGVDGACSAVGARTRVDDVTTPLRIAPAPYDYVKAKIFGKLSAAIDVYDYEGIAVNVARVINAGVVVLDDDDERRFLPAILAAYTGVSWCVSEDAHGRLSASVAVAAAPTTGEARQLPQLPVARSGAPSRRPFGNGGRTNVLRGRAGSMTTVDRHRSIRPRNQS
jgi:hypothetical protein